MRPRILLLSANLPFPPHSGPTNRTFHVLRELSVSFDVTLVAFARRQHHPTPQHRAEAAAALAQAADRVLPPERIASEWSYLTKLSNHARSVLYRQPYTRYEYASPSFAAKVRRALEEAPPNLVHLDSLDLFDWVSAVPAGLPVTCTHHSIESELLLRRAARVSPFTRWYLRRQASLVARLEHDLCPRFALNLMMSEREADVLRSIAPTAKTLVVPNGVDTKAVTPQFGPPRDRCRVVFVGPAYVFANRDAIEYFLSDVWPLIHGRIPSATFRIVGSCAPDLRQRFERHAGVQCRGYVEDVHAELAQAGCAVVPLRFGGGTRLKILDAWATSTPVVSTSVGCEGLAAVNGTNLLIADEPKALADAVVSVVENTSLAARLGQAARRTAEELYDWHSIGATLRAAYRQLMVGASAVKPVERPGRPPNLAASE